MATRRKPAAGTWPLGEYLREQRGKMAIREAARRADISESRWRQVEAGYQQMAGDIRVPVHPRAETIAAMCRAIAADVRRGLELAGHNLDQYAWLFEDPASHLDATDRVEWFSSLPREDREQVLAELQRAHLDAELAHAKRPRKRTAG